MEKKQKIWVDGRVLLTVYIRNLDPENRFVSLKTAETLLRNFCAGKKTSRRARIIESTDESQDDSSDSDSSSGSDDEESFSKFQNNSQGRNGQRANWTILGKCIHT
jgi:hypothetical protein